MSIFRRRLNETRGPCRLQETVTVDVEQAGNLVYVEGGNISLSFSLEGISLPNTSDASFATFAILPAAMEEGIDIQFSRPVDPKVAANAEALSQIWEMWLPGRYRSVHIAGQGAWCPNERKRLPAAYLFSGGVDSVHGILVGKDAKQEGVAITVCGLDKVDERNFDSLMSKTEPLLKQLNCQRIVIKTNAKREPSGLTHGMTLASCLFFLSDLFEEGVLAADRSPAGDAVHFPWGSNYITNDYFAGSNFTVRTVGTISRTEKIAAIVAAGIDLQALSFCRNKDTLPESCGTCGKCIRTKAEFLAALGYVPKIFLDEGFDGEMLGKLLQKPSERYYLFDLYFYARSRGTLEKIPGLHEAVEEARVRLSPPLNRRSFV